MRIFCLFLLLLGGCQRIGISTKATKSCPPGTVHLRENLYIDKAEIANAHWREMVFWNAHCADSITLQHSLPDTTVWDEVIGKPDYRSLVELYFRHPMFNFYPVVGISYQQTVTFCQWRSDRVNELLARKKDRRFKKVRYRLPTLEEWEFAAAGGLESHENPYGLKNPFDKKGRPLFVDSTNANRLKWPPGIWEVKAFVPNAYGIYQMIGNVSEMIDMEGVAKGGNFTLPADSCTILNQQTYTRPQFWLGFRCVCEVLE